MATFEPAIRSFKQDGFGNVKIRIIHKTKPGYISTHFKVHKNKVKNGVIKDAFVQSECAILIKKYYDKCNKTNIDKLDVGELIKYLQEEDIAPSFSDYADLFILTMRNEGRDKPANNYQTAVNSLHSFVDDKRLLFIDMDSNLINSWIKTLKHLKRAKEMYPTHIKTIFEKGTDFFNDYNRNIIKIWNQPFKKVEIPKSDIPRQRAEETEYLKNLFSLKPSTRREELALDVGKLIVCLAGINAVDLYKLEKDKCSLELIAYERSKTKIKRRDNAYMEIHVPGLIVPILKKYEGKKRFLSFSEMYADNENFLRAVNNGFKSLSEKNEINKITTYHLRHSWATFAENKFGYSTEQVGFGLNHESAHKVTRGYIKKTFDLVDEMNKKIIELIFGEK